MLSRTVMLSSPRPDERTTRSFIDKVGFLQVRPVRWHSASGSGGPCVWGLMLSGHHLKILHHFIAVCRRWSQQNNEARTGGWEPQLAAGPAHRQPWLPPLLPSLDSCPTAPLSFLLFPFSAQELLLPSAFSGGLNVDVGRALMGQVPCSLSGQTWKWLVPAMGSSASTCSFSGSLGKGELSTSPSWPTQVLRLFLAISSSPWVQRAAKTQTRLSTSKEQHQQSSPWVGESSHRKGRSISLPSAWTWCCAVVDTGRGSPAAGGLWPAKSPSEYPQGLPWQSSF